MTWLLHCRSLLDNPGVPDKLIFAGRRIVAPRPNLVGTADHVLLILIQCGQYVVGPGFSHAFGVSTGARFLWQLI